MFIMCVIYNFSLLFVYIANIICGTGDRHGPVPRRSVVRGQPGPGVGTQLALHQRRGHQNHPGIFSNYGV